MARQKFFSRVFANDGMGGYSRAQKGSPYGLYTWAGAADHEGMAGAAVLTTLYTNPSGKPMLRVVLAATPKSCPLPDADLYPVGRQVVLFDGPANMPEILEQQAAMMDDALTRQGMVNEERIAMFKAQAELAEQQADHAAHELRNERARIAREIEIMDAFEGEDARRSFYLDYDPDCWGEEEAT